VANWKPLELKWEDYEDEETGEWVSMSAYNTAGIQDPEWDEEWGLPSEASFCVKRDGNGEFYVHDSDSAVLPPPHFIPPPFGTLREAADWCELCNAELKAAAGAVYGTGTWVKRPIVHSVELL
jgi:hypothetical protein